MPDTSDLFTFFVLHTRFGELCKYNRQSSDDVCSAYTVFLQKYLCKIHVHVKLKCNYSLKAPKITNEPL